jgi:hypothetical protein
VLKTITALKAKLELTVIISLILYSECDSIPLMELVLNNLMCSKIIRLHLLLMYSNLALFI